MKLTQTKDLLQYVRDSIPELSTRETEAFWVVGLDADDQPIDSKRLNEGNEHTVAFKGRDLIKFAFDSDAAKLVLVHNHPSGFPLASGPDIELTTGWRMIGDAIELEIVDHVVVGKGGEAFSMKGAQTLLSDGTVESVDQTYARHLLAEAARKVAA